MIHPSRVLSAAALALALSVTLPAFVSADTALVQTANNPKLGTILTNAQGMTLYVLTNEANGHFHCVGGCLNVWPIVTVPAGTAPPASVPGINGTFGTATRPDGTRQLTFNGFPLYMFVNDKAPGSTNGDGIHPPFGGIWRAARASIFPIVNGFVTASASGNSGSFSVSFVSSQPGQGMVLFGSGPGCTGLVEVGTQDATAGTTGHTVQVTGNDFPGSVGNNGIQPGATYSFMVATVSSSGMETQDNSGACWTITIPSK